MTKRPLTATLSAAVCLAVDTIGAEAPSRIMLFAAGGTLLCRDGRSFRVDLVKLAARFKADGVKIPLDVNHATEILAPKGERADPVGWVTAVEIEAGALYGAVEWIDPTTAPALLRAYPYVSPAFPAPDGEAAWLKSVALVASPAIGNQPALAAASDPDHQETTTMKTVLAALGLAETAGEAECLSAVVTLKAKATDVVPKAVHDETIAKLSAATTELDAIRVAGRKAEIDAVLEQALKEKKILPAQRDHYVSLCATDAGLASVKALLAASAPLLGGSGLDDRSAPGTDVTQLSAEDRAVMLQLGLTEDAFREANGLKKS